MAQTMRGVLVGQRLGAYALTELIGAGGMAEVYRARDTGLARDVAVKVLPRSLAEDPGYVARFRDEARHVAALTHPAITPIYAYGEERGLLYLVMPILRESLRERLDREGRLPQREAIRLATQIASGLQAAHELGIIHRDVKPENILLDAEGNALLTDFGIAREQRLLQRPGAARTLAATGLPIGTPEYMAPEQLRGEPLDQRADLYSLGAVLYELLTGDAPFVAESVYEVAASVLKDSIPPPSLRRPDLWPALEVVTLKALARAPQDRYSDMRALIAALAMLSATRTPPAGGTGAERTVATAAPAFVAPDQLDQPGTARNSLPSLPAVPIADQPTIPTTWRPTAMLGTADTTAAPGARFWPSEPLSTAAARRQHATERGPTGTKPLRYGASARRRRVRRALLVALALLLLVGAAGALLVTQSGVWRLVGGASVNTSATATIQAHATGAAQTAQALAQTRAGATATTAPTATAAATATATTQPQAALTLAPEPLALTPSGPKGVCAATQRISNTATQTVGWSWNNPPIPGLQFSVNGARPVAWPKDSTPGIVPGKQDTVYVFMNRCQTFSQTITLTDTLGRTYTFTLSASSGGGD